MECNDDKDDDIDDSPPNLNSQLLIIDDSRLIVVAIPAVSGVMTESILVIILWNNSRISLVSIRRLPSKPFYPIANKWNHINNDTKYLNSKKNQIV
jgi:hypothetical protein